jgi:flagellar biosynthesis/type III secretory pathway protein FliH
MLFDTPASPSASGRTPTGIDLEHEARQALRRARTEAVAIVAEARLAVEAEVREQFRLAREQGLTQGRAEGYASGYEDGLRAGASAAAGSGEGKR